MFLLGFASANLSRNYFFVDVIALQMCLSPDGSVSVGFFPLEKRDRVGKFMHQRIELDLLVLFGVNANQEVI